MPGGNKIRVDTCVYTDYVIPQNYDSMIAKVIVHGKNREESIAKMKSALREFVRNSNKANAFNSSWAVLCQSLAFN